MLSLLGEWQARLAVQAPLLFPAAPPANPLSYLNYHSSLVSAKKWGRFIIGSVKYLLWFIFFASQVLVKVAFSCRIQYD